MPIMMMLLILAILVIVTLAGIFIGSLLLGGMLSASKMARLLAPIFLVVIPASAVGALTGGILVGYFAVKSNGDYVFVGTLGGLFAGGAAGLSVGTAVALFWYWRISLKNRKEASTGSAGSSHAGHSQ
jgi:hypothetical protein